MAKITELRLRILLTDIGNVNSYLNALLCIHASGQMMALKSSWSREGVLLQSPNYCSKLLCFSSQYGPSVAMEINAKIITKTPSDHRHVAL
jgi:hypothetical protein